ncbi:MAG TPA: hypothetical protein VMS22_12820 [Candidatus Eisenbacteria bacterium]|nr:hypothetical protein [Candidatus Eisenbacteria bacterium]
MTNDWCRALGIEPPTLEAVAHHREANTFALLLVALLERGEPMTLAEVATRFEEAGIAGRAQALSSLKRCKPGRPPAYRDGDRYHLDPHDDDLDLWVFRLGLRPPRVARIAPPVLGAAPLPNPDVALTPAELDEAWTDASLGGWSQRRIVLAVLDAHGAPLAPADVVAAVARRTRWHGLTVDATKFARRGSAVAVRDDGRWAVADDAAETMRQVRRALRERITLVRRQGSQYPGPAAVEAATVAWERRRAAHRAELARLSRALLVTFPLCSPRAAVLLDVGEHTIRAFVDDGLDELRAGLATYDVIGALQVRARLRALGFDPGGRRLAELEPPQKTKQLNRRGRTLKATTTLLVQGSCGIRKPFGEEGTLAAYLATGATGKLLRRLEADAKSLHALYEYGRLHGAVRLRWGFLDERLSVPWVDRDEPTLHDLEKSALAMNVPLEVVVGSAPGWSEPWSRVRLARVVRDRDGWQH